MRPQRASAREAVPGAAVIGLDKTIATNDSTFPQIRKTRCPGCARNCSKLVLVDGWHAGRETPLCKRCASGLILVGSRICGLKLKPEPLGAR